MLCGLVFVQIADEQIEMESTPTFLNPPVVEFVLGVQFSPLADFTSAHFGLFWNQLNVESAQWTISSDAPLIEDTFELFSAPLWKQPRNLQFRLESAPRTGRIRFENETRDRMVQIQPTRFHLNWRKTVGLKPSYKSLISEFESYFAEFCRFCTDHHLGAVAPNQWEITYVDSFPAGEYWESPADWNLVLPGLFSGLFGRTDLPLQLEQRSAEWSFEITPQAGRLHISAQAGRWARDHRDTLLLNMTSRGPIEDGKVSTVREGLDIGHRVSVDTFLRIASSDFQHRWGPQV